MNGYAVHGQTRRGLARPANEDHLLLGRFVKNEGGMSLAFAADDDYLVRHGLLFAVADGMGGEADGAMASRLALEAFHTQFCSTVRDTGSMARLTAAIVSAAALANATLLGLAARRTDGATPGCAIAGVCIGPQGYLVYHAGDCRVYRCRHGLLKQLTTDDSVVSAAVEAGYMSHQEAEQSPMRGTITNCVGSESFKLNVREEAPLRPGDGLLICSDGLHGAVGYEACERAIAAGADVEDMAARLVDEAVKAGGSDDISVIMIQAN